MPANSTASTTNSSNHCDVIVIGAGLSGLTTAAFLAQAEARVVFFRRFTHSGADWQAGRRKMWSIILSRAKITDEIIE